MADPLITRSLQKLCAYMYQRYGKKVLILLDEYDTPLQEAYLNGYRDHESQQGSIFSDFNNPDVITTTSRKYDSCFGFTE